MEEEMQNSIFGGIVRGREEREREQHTPHVDHRDAFSALSLSLSFARSTGHQRIPRSPSVTDAVAVRPFIHPSRNETEKAKRYATYDHHTNNKRREEIKERRTKRRRW